jgi:hypothetical protein
MPTLAVWLMTMITPVVGRVLFALGFSVISFVGFDAMFTQVAQQAASSYGSLPGDVLGLAGLAGFPEALGILFGALATRVALISATTLAKRIGAAP